jgi:hypothetical protein
MQKVWRINTNTEQVCSENQEWEPVITKGRNNLGLLNQGAARNTTWELKKRTRAIVRHSIRKYFAD